MKELASPAVYQPQSKHLLISSLSRASKPKISYIPGESFRESSCFSCAISTEGNLAWEPHVELAHVDFFQNVHFSPGNTSQKKKKLKLKYVEDIST